MKTTKRNMKVKVTVQPNNLTFFAETEWNHTLMRVLQDVGITVDAPCGGYNLHWAWASGLLAARSAIEDL